MVKKEVVSSVVGDRGMAELGHVGESSVVCEGDLVGLLCSDKCSGNPNTISVTPFTADSHSDCCSRLFAATTRQLTTVSPERLAGDALQSYVVRRHVDPGVGIGATMGLSGCKWKRGRYKWCGCWRGSWRR